MPAKRTPAKKRAGQRPNTASIAAAIIAALRERGQDDLADAIEGCKPFEQWPVDLQLAYDKALFGVAYTLDGKRVDPQRIVVHPAART